MATMQESIDQALSMLPGDGSLVDYEAYRDSVQKTGDTNARDALHRIIANNLAAKKMVRDEATGKLVLQIGRGK